MVLVISSGTFNSSCLCPFGSTLSGNHGVPRVHYKGKQGEFYIMVLGNEPYIFSLVMQHSYMDIRYTYGIGANLL